MGPYNRRDCRESHVICSEGRALCSDHALYRRPVTAKQYFDENLTSILVSLLTCALGMTTDLRILAIIGQALLAQRGAVLPGDLS